MDKKRIIIVEDEYIIGMDIRDILVNLGYDVTAVITNGDEAVRAVREARPDLVLMDIILPGKIDGIEAAKMIRERTNIPVVYMTGNVDLATVERARESGPYGYVLKPINTQDLFSTIDTALARHDLEMDLKEKSEELEASNEELKAAMEELEATNEAIIRSQTEVEQYNSRLVESEARYRGLFDAIRSGVAIYEVKGNGEDFFFRDVNSAAERIDGQKRDELVGHSIFEVRPGVEKFGLIDVFRRVWKTGVPEGLPLKLYQDERLSAWYENYVYRLPSGEIVAVFDDLTGQKKMEEELRERERRYSTLLGNLPGMAYRCRNDRDWTMEFISDGCFALTGYRPESLIMNRDLAYNDLIREDHRERIWLEIQEALAGRGYYRFEYPVITADGREKWVWEQGCGVFGADGGVIALEGFIADISDRRRAEDALRESEEKHRILLDESTDPIFSFTREGEYRYVNRAFAAPFGLDPRDITGKKIWDIFSKEEADRRYAAVKEVFEKGETKVIEVKVPLPTDDLYYITSIKPIRNEKGEVISVICISKNITERKRVESALQMQRNLGVALSSISDLNEALMAILDAAMVVGDMDSGGIYLVDPRTGGVDLACSKGLSRDYIDLVSHYDGDSPNAEVVREGRPVYMAYDEKRDNYPDVIHAEKELPEGLKILAIIPVLYRGGVIACMNLASKKHADISLTSRNALESLASMIASTIVRLRNEEEVRISLREKEVLLKEVHHRVKNNFQLITSLLSLQARNVTDSESLEQFSDAQKRIRSMALIHEKLYQSEGFARVDLSVYVKSLIGELYGLLLKGRREAEIGVDIGDLSLGIDQAVPCGLLLNELLTNSMKYAFPPDWEGEPKISVSIHSTADNTVEMIVSDNGVGIADDIDLESPQTFGLSLVVILARQLSGEVRIEKNGGLRFVVTFPLQ